MTPVLVPIKLEQLPIASLLLGSSAHPRLHPIIFFWCSLAEFQNVVMLHSLKFPFSRPVEGTSMLNADKSRYWRKLPQSH